MQKDRRLLAWIIALSVSTGLAVGAATVFVLRPRDRASATAVRAECATMAFAFARAADAWIEGGSRQHLERVAELMLLGSAVYVEVGDAAGVVLAARDEEWRDSPLPARPSVSGDAAIVRDARGRLVADVLVSSESVSVRIGYALDSLAAQLGARRWMAASCAAAAWVVLSAGLAALVAARRPRASDSGRFVASTTQDGVERVPLSIREASKSVDLGGQTLVLPPKPYQLLVLLAAEEQRVYGDRDILARLWPDSRFANSSDVRQCVYLLRQKLDQALPGAGRSIVNVKGFGYQYDSRRLPPPPGVAVVSGGSAASASKGERDA
jgi:hypothetical protein